MAGFDAAAKTRIGTLVAAVMADTARDKPGLCREFYGFYLRNYSVDTLGMKRVVAAECGYPSYSLLRANRVSRLTEQSGFEARAWDRLVTSVPARVLVIHGAQDFIPVASSEAWAAAFPQGRLLVIDRSSHYPFVDRPDDFFSAVDTFLRGRWPARAQAIGRR